jgi:glutamate decarboxylase
LEWDFRIPRVHSINASGHKYGMVYPGIGWAIWRTKDCLPSELVFNVNYLGGNMPTFALNFSRPGSQVILQYLLFSGLGREGYTGVMRGIQEVAEHISSAVEKLGPYHLISRGEDLPVFAFAVNDDVENYTVYEVSDRMRQGGWLLPAYSFPENRQDLNVLRVVVRPGMNHEMASLLIEQLREQTEFLQSLDGPLPGIKREAFSHN